MGPGGAAPSLFVRAPGRVNLIGEHIDYNGLPVLPMALQREVRLIGRPRTDGVVRVTNANPAFPERTFVLERSIAPGPDGDWGNYVRAAAQTVVELHGGARAGIEMTVSSDIPVAAGLSSSSALVVAVALALERVNGWATPPLELAAALARGERYVGTAGGGMDQAICLGARTGTASRVDFDPLRLHPTPVPSDWRFVVAHSLVPAEKSGEAQAAYNRRTRECAAALAALTTEDRGKAEPRGYRELVTEGDPDRLLEMAGSLLDPVLLRRFRHVVTEAFRVRAAEEAMTEGDRRGFGGLMLDSHRSLRDDYEVSRPELDALVELAMAGGADGARLTGAGFGGSIVALAKPDAVDGLLNTLIEGYYEDRLPRGEVGHVVFVAEPSPGASTRSE